MKPTVEQLNFINCPGEFVKAVACPGSGKTAALILRAARLAGEGKKVWIITYTNAVANEILDRLDADLMNASGLITVSTIHRFALRSLKRDWNIIDGRHVYGTMVDLCRPKLKKRYSAAAIRDARIKPKDQWHQPTELDAMWSRIHKTMEDHSVVDQDGLLLRFAEDPKCDVDCLMLDEDQDNGDLTWACFNAATKRDGSRVWKTTVGDPNQAIFGWIGDGFALSQRFQRDADFVCPLSINFRSASDIVEMTNRAIKRDRIGPESMASRTDFGSVVEVVYQSHEEESAALISCLKEWCKEDPNSAAVLCRSNATRESMTELLRGAGIPVKDRKKIFPKDWHLLKMWLQARDEPNNTMLAIQVLGDLDYNPAEIGRMLRTAKTGGLPPILQLGHPDLPLLDAWMKIRGDRVPDPAIVSIIAQGDNDAAMESAEDKAAWWILTQLIPEAEERFEFEGSDIGVTITTVHKAKGLEWDHVWVPGMDSRWSGFGPNTDRDEEIRIAYVAMTRAKNDLVVSAVGATDVIEFLLNGMDTTWELDPGDRHDAFRND